MLFIFGISLLFIIALPLVYAEEFDVVIPLGAYDPTLDTPVENWFEPPSISIHVSDTITWTSQDLEGHNIISGKGSGRFGWMGQDSFGTPSGHFESERFMKNESYSFSFEESGTFMYYCTYHPWMEGVVFVGENIPDYPEDSFGQKIDSFPVIQYTKDDAIEVDLTWEPNVILTGEKVSLIFHTYDPAINTNLDKMLYDLVIFQNGKELYSDNGMTGVGGDYRTIVFDESGSIDIIIKNIKSWGTSPIQGPGRDVPASLAARTVSFSTVVYDNPEHTIQEHVVIKPAKRIEIQYEMILAMLLIPAGLVVAAVYLMKTGKRDIEKY